MGRKKKLHEVCLGIFLVILCFILTGFFVQETMAKCIIGFAAIAAMVIVIAKGLEINGMSDIFAVILPEAAPAIVGFFSDIPFIDKVTEVYE